MRTNKSRKLHHSDSINERLWNSPELTLSIMYTITAMIWPEQTNFVTIKIPRWSFQKVLIKLAEQHEAKRIFSDWSSWVGIVNWRLETVWGQRIDKIFFLAATRFCCRTCDVKEKKIFCDKISGNKIYYHLVENSEISQSIFLAKSGRVQKAAKIPGRQKLANFCGESPREGIQFHQNHATFYQNMLSENVS